MADTAPLTLVRAPAWQALTRRLEAAVERDGRLGPARDSILRPVELLRIMAADAPGALGDDVLRADRLRSLLFLAWPYASIAEEARGLLSPGTTALASAAALEGSEPQPYEPGVIDHAALLVLMLAAARVADRPFAPVFVATVHGLALAASAAEVLGRLDPRQPDAAALEVVIETMYVVEAARAVTRNELLRPFALDPVERGRWHCLDHLLASGALARRAVTMNTEWDGATSHEIVGVQPRAIVAGEIIAVAITRAPGVTDPLANAEVVFASAEGAPLVAKAAVPAGTGMTGTTLALAVQVPDGAETGWIGFSRADMIAASNKARGVLRGMLAEELADPCVEGVGRIDPATLIPDYGEIAVPRRRGLNRVEGGVPLVTFAAVSPALVAAGATFSLAWETSGADAVEIERGGELVVERGEPTGKLAMTAGLDDDEVELLITPLRGDARGRPHSVTLSTGSPIAITGVEVTQDGSARLFAGRALDVIARVDSPRALLDGQLFLDDGVAKPIPSHARRPGAVAFTIPAKLVHDGIAFTIVVTDATGSRISVRHGPIVLADVSRVSVVLARPTILDGEERRIDLDDAIAVLARAGAQLGLELSVIDLPWTDDELAVLVQQPTGDHDPSLTPVLESLAHRALITPGFEDAMWLVMLPDDPAEKRSVARWAPGYAARALAVAGPPAIPRLLASVFAQDAPATVRGSYLALHGTLARETVHITELRVDDRHPGPAAPATTKVDAVTLDAAGRELSRQAIHVLSDLRPAQLDVLIQISDAVAAVELRGPNGTLATFDRARGTLTLGVTAADPHVPPSSFEWTWEHDRNARPAVSVLLRRGALATPVLDVDPCATTAELPLWRFAGADGIALYATDGWNTDEQTVFVGELQRDFTAVVRRLSDGRFFADVPRDATVTWRLDGEPRGKGERTLTLRAGETGDLAIEARRGGIVVRDHRSVVAGEVT
jgi:hypothetical protein